MMVEKTRLLHVPGAIGVDEAGRGCLAFSVYAAAVKFPDDIVQKAELDESIASTLDSIRDSKKLSAHQREALCGKIRDIAESVGIGCANNTEIDRYNILNATHIAMHRAIDSLMQVYDSSPDEFHLLIDGNRFKDYKQMKHTCITKGDSTHLSIAAASILAKTARDASVAECCDKNPDLDIKYDFRSNKAYGTKTHLMGLMNHGPDPRYHRMTFARVRK